MAAILQFFDNFGKTLFSLVRVFLLSSFCPKIKKEKQDRECVIMVNGPSLRKTIDEHTPFLSNKDIFCVNLFASSDDYIKIKPSAYVVCAPEWFNPNSKSEIHEFSEKLFKDLAAKTSWPVSLYLLKHAKKDRKWQEMIHANQHIRVEYFNPTPVEGFRWFRHLFFRWNLGMPRPHNVLIPSIVLALNKGYKKIYLVGADHQWLSEVSVDEQNRVLIHQKHFYDEMSATPQTMHKGGRGERNLAEVLMKWVYAFRGYFILRAYAESLHSVIYNATPGSLIDAFERVSPGESPS